MKYKIEWDVKLWTYVVYINDEKKVLNVNSIQKAAEKVDYLRRCYESKNNESRLNTISK